MPKKKASSLTDAIDNLSQKQHVITDTAIQAKRNLDQQDSDALGKKMSLIEEFNHSITLLTEIFKKSNFDDLAMFISHPSRILVINFLIGILRGLGFAIGVFLVITALLYFAKEGNTQILTILQHILS